MKLPKDHPLAHEWRELVRAADGDVRPGADPWVLYEIAPTVSDRLSTIPALPGPIVYAVPEGNGWYYVGQTQQPLKTRISQHLRKIDRAVRWPAVMADPDGLWCERRTYLGTGARGAGPADSVYGFPMGRGAVTKQGATASKEDARSGQFRESQNPFGARK